MDGEADVREAISGDREAFARLYRSYARPVFLDLAARLRRREEAEDVLQATFLAAWTNLPRLNKPGSFVAWLFRIARNKVRDHARRDRPRLVRLGDGHDLIAPAGVDRPEIEVLRDLMTGLKPVSRAIVFLRAVEGWSAEDVARAEGLSASTVRRRYNKALDHLRAGLTERMRDETQRGDRRARQVGLR